jgi:acyl-CoA thioesterase FadM
MRHGADDGIGELRITHRSAVTEDQIDHLGHMNVRFYAVNAQAGTAAMLAGLPGWGGRPFAVHDVYTRHHREQLLGTPLVVRSAVLGAGPGGLRLHHELAAEESGVLAATFVHGISPLDEGGEPAPLPDRLAAAAEDLAVPVPPYAASRTVLLDADLMETAPSLDTLRERGLAIRREREIYAEECDAAGHYRPELAPMLVWAGEPLRPETGPMLIEQPDGTLLAWATMESRIQLRRLPTAGDRIQSFGAGVAVHDKVTHRVHWTYDLDRRELLSGFEIVSLAFDIRSRRPVSIPEEHRQRELAALQPDLAPRATP